VPFKVSVETPATALEAAFSVSPLLPLPGEAMLAGAKVGVTPFGNPVKDNAIADLNPFSAAAETAIDVPLPVATVALVALVVSVKLGVTTVTEMRAVLVSPPPVPVIVTVEAPATAFAAAVKVTVTGEAAVKVEEERRTVMPAGAPLDAKVTREANPPCPVIVTVAAPEPPGPIETLETFGVSVKFDALPSLQ
jgi:hypothetical protein